MYKILINRGSEGWALEDETFKTIDYAVKEAQKRIYGNEFFIVKIVEWQANEKA